MFVIRAGGTQWLFIGLHDVSLSGLAGLFFGVRVGLQGLQRNIQRFGLRFGDKVRLRFSHKQVRCILYGRYPLEFRSRIPSRTFSEPRQSEETQEPCSSPGHRSQFYQAVRSLLVPKPQQNSVGIMRS